MGDTENICVMGWECERGTAVSREVELSFLEWSAMHSNTCVSDVNSYVRLMLSTLYPFLLMHNNIKETMISETENTSLIIM